MPSAAAALVVGSWVEEANRAQAGLWSSQESGAGAEDAGSWTILREFVNADGEREQVLLLASCAREGLEMGEGSALRRRLAAEGLDLGEWADAERVLVASLPAEGAGGSGTGAPERLAGWDSVILRRTV